MAQTMSDFPVNQYPAFPPPYGVTPNFNDPATRAPAVIVACALCLVLLWPIVVLRMYTKTFILKHFGWDDGMWMIPFDVMSSANVENSRVHHGNSRSNAVQLHENLSNRAPQVLVTIQIAAVIWGRLTLNTCMSWNNDD